MSYAKKILIFLPFYLVWVVAASYILFGLCRVCLGPGLLQCLSIILYLALIMIPMVPLYIWVAAVPRWIKKVEVDGKQATATILSVKNTGVVINKTVAVVKLQLRVEPPDEAPFEVSQEKQISMITGLGGYGYAPGAQFRVKYDPNHKNHLIIGDSVIPSGHHHTTPNIVGPGVVSPRSETTEELSELSKLHKSGELSDAEFAVAKKRLLG